MMAAYSVIFAWDICCACVEAEVRGCVDLESEVLMADVEWASIEDAPVKEKFGGSIRVRTIWRSSEGATAQYVEIDPGACWEGIDVHEPGPEEVYVVSGI